MRDIEARTLDLMFRFGRPDPPEPSRAIVHLDIDDQSLSMIGRWPWPRQRLAQAIAELDHLGASVIAIDILLTEPEDPRFLRSGVVDDDMLLEEALANAKANVILAVDPTTTSADLEGASLWADVIGALRFDIRRSAPELISQLELGPERAESVRDHLNKYKRIAVRGVVNDLRLSGELSIGALRERMLRGDDRELDDFPELKLMQGEVSRAAAVSELEGKLPLSQPGVVYGHADSLHPPLKRFARHATPGIVKAEPDDDGVLRRVTLRWDIGGRVYPQLGAAAAAAFLGHRTTLFASDRMVFRGKEEPFEVAGNEILLSWPRIDPKHPSIFARHVPLGQVVALLDREREVAAVEARHDKRTNDLVANYLAGDYTIDDRKDPEKEAEIQEELLSEAELQLGDGEDGDEPEDPEDRRKLRQWRNWKKDRAKLLAAKPELHSARTRLSEAIDGKLVLVGWSASGNFGDFYPTAVHKRTPGVVAHAIVANALITSYVVRVAPSWVGGLMAFFLGVLATIITRHAGPRFSFLLVVLLALLFLTANLMIVFNRYSLAAATAAPLIAMFAAWAGTTVMRAIRDRREKAQLRRQFGARVSPQLFEFLVNNPDMVHLEGEEREVTCFFSDLAGFTAISESLDSKRTVAVLNKYMYAMNEVLTKHAAYVNKFLGDGIMTVWGAFERDTPHAQNACRAALECFERLAEFNGSKEVEGLPDLSMRIGIATGVVTLGDCGAPPDLQDYTVIGDTANLAARLESANKQFGTRILINGRTKELLSEDIVTRPLGRVTVVGQKRPSEIHEVMGIASSLTAEDQERITKTQGAVAAFAEQRFDDARAAWNSLRADPRTATLAGLYLEELDAPAENFDGVLHLTKK
jgi:class 3 adenylate cyclase